MGKGIESASNSLDRELDDLESRLDKMDNAQLSQCEERVRTLLRLTAADRTRARTDEPKLTHFIGGLLAYFIPVGEYFTLGDVLPNPDAQTGRYLEELERRLTRLDQIIHRIRAKR